MMIKRNSAIGTILGVLLTCAAMSLTGCGKLTTEFSLINYGPDGVKRHGMHFDKCTYRYDAQGDLWLTARETHPASEEGASPVTVLLEVHVYWNALPGKTVAEETTDNATIRYLVSSSKGTAFYAGTCFALVRERGEERVAQLEGGRVMLRTRTGDTDGQPGDSRIEGNLLASPDVPATVDVTRQIDLHAGA